MGHFPDPAYIGVALGALVFNFLSGLVSLECTPDGAGNGYNDEAEIENPDQGANHCPYFGFGDDSGLANNLLGNQPAIGSKQ